MYFRIKEVISWNDISLYRSNVIFKQTNKTTFFASKFITNLYRAEMSLESKLDWRVKSFFWIINPFGSEGSFQCLQRAGSELLAGSRGERSLHSPCVPPFCCHLSHPLPSTPCHLSPSLPEASPSSEMVPFLSRFRHL